MSWTDESIIAEFTTHLAYWQQKLRLTDLDVRVFISDFDSSYTPSSWCSIEIDNGWENPHRAVIRIRRGTYDEQTRYDVWETCAHELVHAINWAMSRAFEPLSDHFSTSQINMAKSLMKRGNESIAYKWEILLSAWFADDAPPKEIP